MTYAPIFYAKSAPQAALPCITRINEKRPCDTFPYQSTQSAKMSTIASNWQFWAFPTAKHAQTNEKAPFSLIHTPTCPIQVRQLVCSALLPFSLCAPSISPIAHSPSSSAHSHTLRPKGLANPPAIIRYAKPYALTHLLQPASPSLSRQPAEPYPPNSCLSAVPQYPGQGGRGGSAQLFSRHAPRAKRPTIRLAPRTRRGNRSPFPPARPVQSLFSIVSCTRASRSCTSSLPIVSCTTLEIGRWNWVPLSCGLDPAPSRRRLFGISRSSQWRREALKKMTLALAPWRVCHNNGQVSGRVLTLSISPESRSRPYENRTPGKGAFFSLSSPNGRGCSPVLCSTLHNHAISVPAALSTTNIVTRGALFTFLFFSLFFLSFLLFPNIPGRGKVTRIKGGVLC
jgi:hypothetical protein